MSRRWLPPALWAVLILILTSIPGDAVPDVGDVPAGTDKVVHAVLYAVLGWLLVRARPQPRQPAGIFLLLLLGVAAFAAVDEWHQHFIPGREPSMADWLVDIAGATVGAGFGSIQWRRDRPS